MPSAGHHDVGPADVLDPLPPLRLTGMYDAERVYAVMVWPDRLDRMVQWLTVHHALVNERIELELGRRVPMDPRTARTLARSPGRDALELEAWTRIEQAGNAAAVLTWIFAEVEGGNRDASIHRAIDHRSKELVRARGGGARASERTIKGDWKRFRPVAHLWAALMVIESRASDFDGPLQDFLAQNFEALIAVSEEFRAFGESQFFEGPVRGSLLPRAKTVRLLRAEA